MKDRILKEGDVISVDVCVRDDGFVGDNCRTVPVGEVYLKWPAFAGNGGISLRWLVHALHKNRVGDISYGSKNMSRLRVLQSLPISLATVWAEHFMKTLRSPILEGLGRGSATQRNGYLRRTDGQHQGSPA